MVLTLKQTCLIGLVSGGLALIGSLSIAPAIASPPSQGRQYYEAEDYGASFEWLLNALKRYEQNGDRRNQAATLNNLALVYYELGQWEQANQAVEKSLEFMESETADEISLHGQILNTLGLLQLHQGQAKSALETWQTSERLFIDLGDQGNLLKNRINQAQALQKLGFYRQALILLTDIQPLLEGVTHPSENIVLLRSLGNTFRELGQSEQAEENLRKSLQLAKASQSSNDIALGHIALGNLASANGAHRDALYFYQQARKQTPNSKHNVIAQLHQLRSIIAIQNWPEAEKLWPPLLHTLITRPTSSTTTEARLNLAHSLKTLYEQNSKSSVSRLDIAQLLSQAQGHAHQLGDRTLESVALGQLGQLYEEQQQYSEAIQLTHQALALIDPQSAGEIAYQWHWQLGRIAAAQGQKEEALAAYDDAVQLLGQQRQALVSSAPDAQFNFQTRIEPLYREYVSLLIQAGNTDSHALEKARQAMESLQLAELDNFFRSACLDTIPVIVEDIDPMAAVIYPIILPEQIAVIVRLPGEELKLHTSPISAKKLNWIIDRLRISLEQPNSSTYLTLSQQLYDGLLRKAMPDIKKSEVETLVFVPDANLSQIPPAVLHDGDRYLIENYAVSVTPGLQLLQTGRSQPKKLRVLIAALTEAQGGFPALSNASKEIEQIQSLLPHQSLINDEFTQANLYQGIENNSFEILHIATHGQFSSDPRETFLQAWGERINIEQLSRILQNNEFIAQRSLDLLILSACETALGDRRSVLGLAGMATRSGAKSTLASLWQVNDESTQYFMSQVYAHLKDTQLNKAQVIQQTQKIMLDSQYNTHPYYWASFILTGQW